MSPPEKTTPATRAPRLDRTRIERILRGAVRQGASDVHFKAGEAILLRLGGELRPVQGPRLDPVDTRAVFEAMRPARLAALDAGEVQELDFSFAVAGAGRFRVNAFRQRGSLALVARVIPMAIPELAELGLPAILHRLVEEERGIVLVTGATGSGKSTAIAAMLQHVNRTKCVHVITIEDPIEFLFLNQRASIVQREVGTDTEGFAPALRAALRQDPDILMIGEMRDAETMDVALKAAETGHLVLSTAHTIDAAMTVQRLVGAMPASEQAMFRLRLAEALRAVVSLRLLPRADGQGVVPAAEILLATRRVQECLRNAARQHELGEAIAKGAHYGMRSFDQDLVRLVREGTITREIALAAASSRADVELRLDLGPEEEEAPLELDSHQWSEEQAADREPPLRVSDDQVAAASSALEAAAAVLASFEPEGMAATPAAEAEAAPGADAALELADEDSVPQRAHAPAPFPDGSELAARSDAIRLDDPEGPILIEHEQEHTVSAMGEEEAGQG